MSVYHRIRPPDRHIMTVHMPDKMHRRSFLAQTAGVLPMLAADTKRPNILWISCEDTSPQIGCYGDPHAITPNIGRLAREGVRYTRAHTVAGVCAPSRSGIITGMYPTTLGSQYMRCSVALPSFVKCFPEYLRNAGYYCTNNSKTDYNFPVPHGAWDENGKQAHWNKRKPNQPFFAVFNIETTHESRIRLRGEEYQKVTSRLTPQERQDPKALDLPPYYPDTPESRRDWAQYYELITTMDHEVGDRLKELDAAGLREDTIVCFWGDHGVGLPRAKRWLYESSTHVPLVIRIPARFRTSDQGTGSTDDQLVSFIDLAPTMLNLAGVPVPSHFQGRAFLGPNLTPPREYVFAGRDRMDETYDSVRMVRDRRYRYLRNFEPQKPYAQHLAYMEEGYVMKELRRAQREGRLPPAAKLFMGETKPIEELYDVDTDPHELKNLASSPAHRAVLERLRAAQKKWAIDTRDVGLIPEPDLEERGEKAGSRYEAFHQPGSETLLRELRSLVGAVNAGQDSAPIRRSLTHSDPAFRYWALIGIGKDATSLAASKPAIIKAETDPSPTVRIQAFHLAAKYFEDSGAIPKLAAEMTSPNPYVRLHAAQALAAAGDKAAAVRGTLAAASRDSNEYVKRVAEHALAALPAG